MAKIPSISIITLFSIIIPNCFSLYDNTEYFSSISHIQNLQLLEFQVVESFNQIISDQEKKLSDLKEFLSQVKSQNKDESSLNNPISQYQLIRRMVNNWPGIIEDTNVAKDMQEKFEEITKHHDLPTKEDLAGSAEAIMRLQDTYLITADRFADGSLERNGSIKLPLSVGSGQKTETETSTSTTNSNFLSAEDCLHIAKTAYKNEDDYHMLIWSRIAYLKYKNGDTLDSKGAPLSKLYILDHISFALANSYYRHFAYDVVELMLELIKSGEEKADNYDIKRFEENKNFYLSELEKGNYINVMTNDFWETFEFPAPNQGMNEHYFKNYESLCRQEDFFASLSQKTIDKLFCFYHTQNGNPRLIFKPVKTELVQLKPSKVIFHDFLNEEEINFIKAAAKPKLRRATVHNIQTGELEHAKYRVQKTTWLTEEEYPFLEKINAKIEDVTGISKSTAELFQVANYGIGGQYEPHYDHSRRPDANEGDGARIATLLMYLTDVESGGHTVFLDPELSLKPKKGAAAFWFNLKPSSLSDDATKHAGCPVLIGQKWVANKWFHDRGNEFRRQCYDNEDFESRFNINGWLGVQGKFEELPDW